MEKLISWLGAIFSILLVVVIVYLVVAFPIMLLWNWLMPVIFGLTTINIWQALGLGLLSGMLFKPTSFKGSKDD